MERQPGRNVFNAGMRGQKGSEYEGGHRVPMFIHWPAAGLNEHHEIDTLCHAIDLVPTLLDVCKVENAAEVKFDGMTLKNLIASKTGFNWPDRMIITDSQRVVDPIKWRKSSVMSQRYRLINGVELYDIKTDPGQAKNISKENPNQVEKMRTFYDQWWAELEPTFAQTTEIQLGHPNHPKVIMTAHDWLNTSPPWHQGMIRGAKGGNKPKFSGHWAIKVLEEGTYKVSLLRWPEEANHPINATLPPGKNVPGASKAFRTTKGASIKATAAALLLNGKEIAKKTIGKKDTAISFTTKLTKGSHAIAPIFRSPKGETGAFYCIIEKQP
jgi:arylsulfatase B